MDVFAMVKLYLFALYWASVRLRSGRGRAGGRDEGAGGSSEAAAA